MNDPDFDYSFDDGLQNIVAIRMLVAAIREARGPFKKELANAIMPIVKQIEDRRVGPA
jgi:hypothetical protein